MNRASPIRFLRAGLAVAVLFGSACVTGPEPPSAACTPDAETLRVAFYAFFDPVSYRADEDSASPAFGTHLGYEADLLTALEAMDGAQLSFERMSVSDWNSIWLLRQHSLKDGSRFG